MCGEAGLRARLNADGHLARRQGRPPLHSRFYMAGHGGPAPPISVNYSFR